jgi:HAD superfamily hydrolase (TIGR01509 family)
MKFSNFCFDCDGVLIDSEILANRVESELKIEEQLSIFVGLAKDHPTMIAELARLPENYAELFEERIQRVFREELVAIAGARDCLQMLRGRCCVVSSSEPDSLESKLKLTGLDHCLQGIMFHRRLVPHCKPAPDLYLHALKTLNWSASTSLVIEDSVPGVLAGKAAGMTVWGFLGGTHIRDWHARALMDAGADSCVMDFPQLFSELRGVGVC